MSETNVGIGVTNPSGRLHVKSSDQFTSAFIHNTGGGIGTGAALRLVYDANSDNLDIIHATSGAGEVLTVESTGRIGIGVANPKTSLHIPLQGLQIGDSPSGVDNFHIVSDLYGGTRGFRLYNGVYNFGNPLVTVKPLGEVGIGTTNPGEKLEVAGNLKVTGSFIQMPRYSIPPVTCTGSIFGAMYLDSSEGTGLGVPCVCLNIGALPKWINLGHYDPDLLDYQECT